MEISGWWVTFALLAPNALVAFMPPRAVPSRVSRGKHFRAFELLERFGQAACFITPIFLGSRALGSAPGAFAVMAFVLVFYYSLWLRYALGGRRYAALFEPVFGIPVPMAVAPVIYFAAAAVAFVSAPLFIASLVLAVGHLYVSVESRKLTLHTASTVEG